MARNEQIRHLLESVKDGNEEALEILYKKYFYIVDNFASEFDENDRDDIYLIIGNILKKSIVDFCNNEDYDKYFIVTFILNRLRYIKYKLYPDLLKTCPKDPEFKRYEELAFTGDIKARKHIFHKYYYIADAYAKNLYKCYVELSKCKSDNLELIISVEDMMQDYYIMIWKFINNFYDDTSNRNKYLSSILIKYIKNSHQTKIRHLERKIIVEYLEDVNNYTYEDVDNEFQKIEDRCLLDYLQQAINSKNKDVLPFLRQGYTFEEAGQEINCSKGTAHAVINVCRHYVKKNKIQR